MQWARESCKDICLGEGRVPGFGQIALLFLCFVFLSEQSTPMLIFCSQLVENLGGRSSCCFQEQLT